MIEINQLTCSASFRAALQALDGGGKIRRTSWPDGMHLVMAESTIAMQRPGSGIAPQWQGPSADDSEADDWVMV